MRWWQSLRDRDPGAAYSGLSGLTLPNPVAILSTRLFSE